MKVKLICQECGKEYFRHPSAATHSHFCSNACRGKMTSRLLTKDLIGQRFGRLLVVERSTNGKDGETRWLCHCDCGNTSAVYKQSLVSGKTQSCGCLHKEVRPKQASVRFSRPIAPGIRFGRLIVIRENGRRGGCVAYLCKCDCGKETTVSSTALRNRNTKSCGCYGKEQRKKSTTTHGLSSTPSYKSWRHHARREADAEWTIEMSNLLFEIQPACVVCGSTFKLSVDHVYPFSKGNGLKPGNAVVLCGSCNSKKHNKDISKLPHEWRDKIERAALQFLSAWNSL